jgi:hypothetical protein
LGPDELIAQEREFGSALLIRSEASDGRELVTGMPQTRRRGTLGGKFVADLSQRLIKPDWCKLRYKKSDVT